MGSSGSKGLIGFQTDDDFIPPEQYVVLGIPVKFVPAGFKVWKYHYPPVDCFLNAHGGNAYGLSLMEMSLQALSSEDISQIDSGDYLETNQFYADKGMYKLLSSKGVTYFLVPQAVEATIRFEVTDKVSRISQEIRHFSRHQDYKIFRVATFEYGGTLLLNRLVSENPQVVFDQLAIWGSREKESYELIYLAVDPHELYRSLIFSSPENSLSAQARAVLESPEKFFSFLLLKIFRLLVPGGRVLLLGPNTIMNPDSTIALDLDKESIWFKRLIFFLRIKKLPYRVKHDRLLLQNRFLLDFCNFPETFQAKEKKKICFTPGLGRAFL